MVSFGWGSFMPLTRQVGFKAVIGKGNRIQVPTLIRWEFKLEPTQLLTVTLRQFNLATNETFFAKMNKDGRITVPKINTEIIKTQIHKETTLNDYAFEITLSPE